MLKRVLIANRGEIAVRIIRTLREMGIESVAVYSEADRQALHVRMADLAYEIGPAPSQQSYLRTDKILEVAKRSNSQAIHPGYGFLSENAVFAKAVRDAGMLFIGPSSDSINQMGDKVSARAIMIKANVPVVPGTKAPVKDVEEALEKAKEIGFPMMLKAAAGGGGKGMRRIFDVDELPSAFLAAQREAQSAFNDGRIYLERYIQNPHHIEVQIFGDQHGNVIHLYERECSIQRRHQKVVEEAPSPFLKEETRQKITETAVQAAAAIGYEGAGTVEFLTDADQNFYFLEMNTRLQVEHPVTEMTTGIDLVRLQLEVAMGQPLPYKQSDIKVNGWAIEARIYAENPALNFMPSPGTIKVLQTPSGPGVRDDSGVYEGSEIPMVYDPMISKLICWGKDRDAALARMRRALQEYRVVGVHTTIPFHQLLLQHPDFIAGNFDTSFLDNNDIMGSYQLPEDDQKWADFAAMVIGDQKFGSNKQSNNQQKNNNMSGWKRAARLESVRKSLF